VEGSLGQFSEFTFFKKAIISQKLKKQYRTGIKKQNFILIQNSLEIGLLKCFVMCKKH